MFALATTRIADQLPQGGSQCFPFYTYDEDGSNRRENITDWALNQFRTRYSDPNITKWDIFHYVYAVLHHPEYRQRYAANLKRELPRIPFVGSSTPLEDCHHEVASATEGSAVDFLRHPERRRRFDAGVEGPAVRPEHGDTAGSPSITDGKTGGSSGLQPGSPARAALARDGVGQAGDKNGAPGAPSTLPKAGAQPGTAERSKETVGAPPLSSAKADDRVGTNKEIFRSFADAGKCLADLHVNYEQQPEYPLERVEKGQLNWRVEKMRLSRDKTTLVYNEFLTLKGIPPETYEYRLGNRSALEWVIDQYQISTDKRSGIVNDPNRADDPEYIVRLIGQVITVSLETMKIVKALPALEIDALPTDN